MSLQLRLFGGNSDAGKLTASNDGSHAIDKAKVLASTDTSVITPLYPGNFDSVRTVPVVPAPHVCEYFLICWFDSVRYAVREILYSLAQNLLIPKFCNGLIGCNRTDSVVPAR